MKRYGDGLVEFTVTDMAAAEARVVAWLMEAGLTSDDLRAVSPEEHRGLRLFRMYGGRPADARRVLEMMRAGEP